MDVLVESASDRGTAYRVECLFPDLWETVRRCPSPRVRATLLALDSHMLIPERTDQDSMYLDVNFGFTSVGVRPSVTSHLCDAFMAAKPRHGCNQQLTVTSDRAVVEVWRDHRSDNLSGWSVNIHTVALSVNPPIPASLSFDLVSKILHLHACMSQMVTVTVTVFGTWDYSGYIKGAPPPEHANTLHVPFHRTVTPMPVKTVITFRGAAGYAVYDYVFHRGKFTVAVDVAALETTKTTVGRRTTISDAPQCDPPLLPRRQAGWHVHLTAPWSPRMAANVIAAGGCSIWHMRGTEDLRRLMASAHFRAFMYTQLRAFPHMKVVVEDSRMAQTLDSDLAPMDQIQGPPREDSPYPTHWPKTDVWA